MARHTARRGMIANRRSAPAKSGSRFSDEIMLDNETGAFRLTRTEPAPGRDIPLRVTGFLGIRRESACNSGGERYKPAHSISTRIGV